jgi:hypothetical protein
LNLDSSLFRPLRSKMATAPRGSDWSTMRRTRKVSYVNTWTGRPCSMECCDYMRQHTEKWRTVPCRSVRREKRRLRTAANVEKEIATLTTVAASVRGRRRKNITHYRSTKATVRGNKEFLCSAEGRTSGEWGSVWRNYIFRQQS